MRWHAGVCPPSHRGVITMTTRFFRIACLIAVLAVPGRGYAQYLFVDANGDGVSTSADRLSAAGPSTIAIWLRTDQNKDGSKAVCAADPSAAVSIFSYEFILHAAGGSVKWGTYTNLLPGMQFSFGTFSSGTDYYTGYGGTNPLPPGKYKLGTVAVTPTSGDPRLDFASSTPIWAPLHTSFGSMCAGRAAHNTLVYAEDQARAVAMGLNAGADWMGADGVASPSSVALASSIRSNSQTQARPDGVSPNPLNPQGLITFSMKVAGRARVTLYDTQGHLLRTLLPQQLLDVGSHSVRIDGLDERGKHLSSGVYFYKIETPDGETQGRFVVMK